MSTIFALFPGTIPAFAQIQEALEPTHKFVLVDKVESLTRHRDEKGVVLIGGDPTRISMIVNMIHNVAPLLACVVALNENQLDDIDPTTATHVDFLVCPYRPLELQARIHTALNLSEMRFLIETSAQLDEVTDLYNYQFFLKRLGQEMSLAKRHFSPVTVIIISIHYYDVYMDTYGHGFVFNILKQIAQVVKDHIRQEDIMARLGDSEVAILLPLSTEKGAASLAQRLVKSLEKITIHVGDQVEHLSLKMGIAGFPSPDEADMDPDMLIRYARHALHVARCDEDKKIQLFSEMRPFVG